MKDTNPIYKKLALHLDNLPGGYPATESGVELRILRRLFTLDEAELALHVGLIPAPSRVIARRAKIDPEEAERRLAEMARKGLIISLVSEPSKPMLYVAAQFVIGIWEFHVNDLDVELVRDFEEYFPTLVKEAWKVPQLRTIPVNRSLSHQLMVLPYERGEELIRQTDKILVAPCICRRELRLAGKGCDHLEEACLVFGSGADLYLRNGLGRIITQQEALEILKRADESGMVLQPGNSQESTNICCCCGCCCGVLRGLKLFPKPAAMVSSPFVAAVNPDKCEGCGTCTTRCQMEALRLEAETVVLDLDRCIGCGLCVSTCPTDSLTMVRKPESAQPLVPKNWIQNNIRLGQARGKISSTNLAMMMIKSKVERFLAPK